jgi:hypothetical protein
VFIHVSKEYESGEERAVKIHLGGAIFQDWRVHAFIWESFTAFRVASKNSPPEIVATVPPQNPPYVYPSNGAKINRYQASGKLQVTFTQSIETEGGKTPKATTTTQDILRKGTDYSLLKCGNPVSYPTPEFAPLVTPFFYQDNLHTLFVEPSLTETTTQKTEEYGISYPVIYLLWLDDARWRDWVVVPTVPIAIRPPNPIDPLSHFNILEGIDWVKHSLTGLQFGDTVIGQTGGLDATQVLGSALNVIGSSGVNPAVFGDLTSGCLAKGVINR